MKATFIRDLRDWGSDAQVYHLSPPMRCRIGYVNEDDEEITYMDCDHVVVSAVTVPGPFGGPETYIFPWDEERGETFSMLEQKGSIKGFLDHHKALNEAGYEVVE